MVLQVSLDQLQLLLQAYFKGEWDISIMWQTSKLETTFY